MTQFSSVELFRNVFGQSVGQWMLVFLIVAALAAVCLKFRYSGDDALMHGNVKNACLASIMCIAAVINPHSHSYDTAVYWGSLIVAMNVVIPGFAGRIHSSVLCLLGALMYVEPITTRAGMTVQPGTIGMLLSLTWMLVALPKGKDMRPASLS